MEKVYYIMLLTVCLTASTIALSSSYHYDTKYFDQTVDHFNFASYGNRTFKQKYLYNDTYWDKANGPIFFYTGNEGLIETFLQNSGLVYELASESHALIVFAEHRYYGASLPFGAKSFSVKNISLLTVEQAMADFATLIIHLKDSLGAYDRPVIAFGGSYGGMLSAYMRFKYPNVIHGALAASAPIYLIAGKGDRTEFFADVTKDFENADPLCPKAVRSAFNRLGDLVTLGNKGLVEISQIFKLCKQLQSKNEIAHLQSWIRNSFTTLAMMDYPYPTDFTSPLPSYPVNVACKFILAASDSLQGLAKAAGILYNGTGTLKCFDIYTEFIECADPTGCGTGPNGQAWDYQACTELILPEGSNGKTDMFPVLPFTLKMRDAYCQKTWKVTPRNDWIGISVWGEDISSSSNIIFSNGDLDPWRGGGVLSNVTDSLIALTVQGGAHHYDLRGSDSRDLQSVVAVRKQEATIITKWISEAKQK